MFHFFMHHTVIEGSYNLSQIQIEQELGRGNSHVFTAFINNQRYALKQIQIKDDQAYLNFLQQVKFMSELSRDSSSMVKYYGYFITYMQVDQYQKHKYAFIVMECAQMNLEQLVVQYRSIQTKFTQKDILKFIETILLALCQLEAKHIAHCDIKPQNILIMESKEYDLKLCDVGSCKVVTDDNISEATILGTVPFLAPQLIRIKNKKITSSNPFKSDVFSFGLVILYLVTFKKFKSQQRLQVEQIAYKEILHQWIKEAMELVNHEFIITEILKICLDFDQNQRPMFQDLLNFYFQQKNKKNQNHLNEIEQLQRQEEEKNYTHRIDQSYFSNQGSPSNCINLFRSRKVEKSSNKQSSNGQLFRITTTSVHSKLKSNRNESPMIHSAILKKRSLALATSPGVKKLNQSFQMQQLKKIVYINEKTKEHLQKMKSIQLQEEKTFVLELPFVPFKEADTVAVLAQCGLQVLYMLSKVKANRFFLQYEKVQTLGLPNERLALSFPKIRVNLSYSSLAGGYSGLLKSFCHFQLQVLELKITESEVTYIQVIELLDNLQVNCPRLNTLLLSWQRNILSQEEHFQLTQKISRLPLKRLFIIMNENYIKYDKQTAWLLPRQCETLYLQYGDNLLNSIINNLSLSIGTLSNLKQLYIIFLNNNLQKVQINMISKSIAQLKQLEKIILDLSFNKIDDLNYLQKNLSQHINLSVIELRLHKTETPFDRCIALISNLKELFQFKLKILKISLNRVLSLPALKARIQPICFQKGVRKVLSDVIGFDNSYFMIYFKKKPKTFSRYNNKGTSISVRKDKPNSFNIKHSNTISMATTISGFNSHTLRSGRLNNPPPPLQLPFQKPGFQLASPKPTSGICSRLYTTQQTYDNYMCIGCCQEKQRAKSTFYCKFCIQNCFHKGHNIVKVYSRTRCSCSHSGHCQSDSTHNICAERLKISYKKKFDCLKCQMSYCVACILVCTGFHNSFVKSNTQMSWFVCAGNDHKDLIQT